MNRAHIRRAALAPLPALALAALVPFALLAVWARVAPVGAWELELLVALTPGDGLHSVLIGAVNRLGDLAVWSALVLVLTVAALVVRRVMAAGLVALTILGDVAASLAKLLVERTRPEGVLIEHFLGQESFAFPSGHVLRATALSAALLWLLTPPRLRLPAAIAGGVIAGLLMGYARIALGVHWPSDVVGGLLLGLGWFAVTGWLVGRRWAADEPAVGGR